MKHFLLVMLMASALSPQSIYAADPPLRLTGSVRVRVEAWKWFETPGYDDRYEFLGGLLRAGVAHRFNTRWDGQIEAAVPVLLGLPENAVAPAPRGQLGFGGTYFATNKDENAISAILKQGWVRATFGPAAVRVGRFEFIDGAEVVPKDPTLAEVKRNRVAHRLIGNFGFSHVGRSVDGAQLTWQMTPTAQLTAVAFRPTAGAFNVNANRELDVNVLYGAVTRTTSSMDARLFTIGYRDDRNTIKTDNRPLAIRRGDTQRVEVTTFGGHYIRAIPLAGGKADVLLWGALQQGNWGKLDHRANARDFELGWRRGPAAVRVGAFRSSGDSDPADSRHGTFFQILPTPRVYARFPFYNAMNSRDVFATASFKVTPKFTISSEVHRLTLSEQRDLWYSGGGAFEGSSFGFAGRPSNGKRGLAEVIDLNGDYALNAKTSVSAYAAIARGDDVVTGIYAGRNASLVYFEFTRKF